MKLRRGNIITYGGPKGIRTSVYKGKGLAKSSTSYPAQFYVSYQ